MQYKVQAVNQWGFVTESTLPMDWSIALRTVYAAIEVRGALAARVVDSSTGDWTLTGAGPISLGDYDVMLWAGWLV